MNHTNFEHLKKLMALGKISADELEERLRIYDSINDDEALEELRQLVSETKYDNQPAIIAEQRENSTSAQNISLTPHHSPLISRHSLYRIAAAIALLLVAGGLVWYTQYTKVTPPEISQEVLAAMQHSQQSGRVGAMVDPIANEVAAPHSAPEGATNAPLGNEAPSGAVGGSTTSPLWGGDGGEAVTDLLHAQRVTTYHDKEFWLKLDDGTLVHLNYNTRVIYPEKFGRSKREVYLNGEAYFMVAKDKSRPFIVHTPEGDIKVHGTEFYASTRPHSISQEGEKAGLSVVLVKGSVGVTPNVGREQMMTPGQQCSVLNGQCSMNEVDLEPYKAWNEGRFSFDDVTLEKLMDVLSRWYELQVKFENEESRKVRFTGELDKFVSVEAMLRAIRKVTDIDVRISGNTIIIQ